jgi:hypothetical protein
LESSFPPKRPPPRAIPKRGASTPRENVEDAEADDTDAKTDNAMRKLVKKEFMVVRCEMKILINLTRFYGNQRLLFYNRYDVEKRESSMKNMKK